MEFIILLKNKTFVEENSHFFVKVVSIKIFSDHLILGEAYLHGIYSHLYGIYVCTCGKFVIKNVRENCISKKQNICVYKIIAYLHNSMFSKIQIV